eukprot:5304661-Ditylum_brightwellii.AAC.1
MDNSIILIGFSRIRKEKNTAFLTTFIDVVRVGKNITADFHSSNRERPFDVTNGKWESLCLLDPKIELITVEDTYPVSSSDADS